MVNKLRDIKKKKRQMYGKIRDNWELGQEQAPVSAPKKIDLSDSDISDSEKKPKGKVAKAKKTGVLAKDKCTPRKLKSIPPAEKRGEGLDVDPNYTTEVKNARKRKMKRNVTTIETEPSQLDHRPLDDWMAYQFYTKTKTSTQLNSEVIADITLSIDGKRQKIPHDDKSSVLNLNTVDPSSITLPQKKVVKRKKEDPIKPATKRQKTSAVKSKQDDLIKKDKEEFFEKDSMLGEFGGDPANYPLFATLAEEERQRDELYRNDGRECFDDTLELEMVDPPKVTKEYNVEFLRESRGIQFKERDCGRGEACILNYIPTVYPDSIADVKPEDAFVCREWLNPIQKAHLNETGELPETPQLCYQDNILLTNFRYYRYMHKGEEPKEILQDHQIVIGGPGEYRQSDCIPPVLGNGNFTGLPRPFPKFSANRLVYDKTKDPDNQDRLLKCVVEQNMDF